MNKKRPHKKHKKLGISRKPTLVFSLLVVGSFFVLFFGSVHLFHLTNTVHVLGAQTVLSDRTEEEHADRTNHKDEQTIEEESKNTDGKESTIRKAKVEKIQKELELRKGTLVDCTGPEGKHITTTYSSCYEINKKAGNDSFSFIPLTKSSSSSGRKKQEARLHMEEKQKNKTESVEKKKMLQEELEKDDGEVHSQTDLQNKLASWEEEENKVVLETSDKNTSLIKHKNTKAESLFPVSVNDETNELTIITPSGTKTVTVLPDTAVENILRAHTLTNVETELSSESGDMTQKTVLTEMNNEPVFAVQGVLEKEVLGFIPVAFSKTVYVSADTGEIIKTDQSLFNTILESISF